LPNAILSKHDGTIVSIPADSVVGIWSTALDKPDEQRPGLRSVVMSTFRGLTADFLAHTAEAASIEIEKARASKKGLLRVAPQPRKWLELAAGDDVTRVLPGSVAGYEVVKVEAGERLRLFWRTPEGKVVPLDVNHTEENRAVVDADIEAKD
jgi:tRNA A37 threonylcarbamoyladenosine synthetase subunit TsaC/SUA5/YrdC